MKKIIFIIAYLVYLLPAGAQIQFDFEKEVPQGWKASGEAGLSLSQARFKSGSSSLQWNWKAKETLTIPATDELRKAAKNGYLQFWIYNDQAVNAPLIVRFVAGEKAEYMFNFNLRFTGWRACRLRFSDMTGEKSNQAIDKMEIIAPRQGGGTLYLDRLSFIASSVRNITPDAQMPFLVVGADTLHWLGLWPRYTDWTYDQPETDKLSDEQIRYMNLIMARAIDDIKGAAPSADRVKKATERYNEYGIKKQGNTITGKPIVMSFEKTDNDMNLNQVGAVLLELARVWHHTGDKSFIDMYMNLLDHLINQGFDIGSSMGSADLYGYSFRDLAPSMLIMRPALEATGRLEYCAQLMTYWADIQVDRKLPEDAKIEGMCDIWNTQLPSKVMAISLMPDSPKKWREFELLNRWVSHSLNYTPGTFGGLKPDGTIFHHWGLYLGYGMPAFDGLGKYLQMTKYTPFQPTDEALANLGKALLEARFYTQKNFWGFGISGRDPLQGEVPQGTINCLGQLAIIGEPFTEHEIWKEAMQAYIRWGGKNLEVLKKGMTQLLQAESAPQGNRTYNYAALGVHRRDNWAVLMKGYNQHVWSTEIYANENRFGRYMSYGSAQIISADSPADCGFQVNGWDWNRFPGTTTIHLPLEKLESPLAGTLTVLSPEKFAGASNLGNTNGIFGMILQETDIANFTPSFRAYKSIFCFDKLLVFLGSGIQNSNTEYPTETTLFQYALTNKKDPFTYNKKKVTDFPTGVKADKNVGNYLSDPAGNYYFLAPGQQLAFERKDQTSMDHRKKGQTTGSFASAWIDHGMAPKNDSYHYSVLVQPSVEELDNYINRFNKNELPYQIVRQDSLAHIVKSEPTATTGYVIFKENTAFNTGYLMKADSQCLVMIKENGQESLQMSVCNPDLNLAPEPENPNQRAIYTPSRASVVTLELKGKWSAAQSAKYTVSYTSEGNTILKVTCINGTPEEMILNNKK